MGNVEAHTQRLWVTSGDKHWPSVRRWIASSPAVSNKSDTARFGSTCKLGPYGRVWPHPGWRTHRGL